MVNKLKKLEIVIAVLAILLCISLVALACVFVFLKNEPSKSSDVVFDNVIEPITDSSNETEANSEKNISSSDRMFSKALHISPLALKREVIDYASTDDTVLLIYRNHPSDSTPFVISNMFPGDIETKTYLIEVSHRGTVSVKFHADIRDGYEKLAEVLKCRIVLANEEVLLYEGLMRDMPEDITWRITSEKGQTTKLRYDISIYLETSVGNEYMNKSLVADFRWYVPVSGGSFPPITDDNGGTNNEMPPFDSDILPGTDTSLGTDTSSGSSEGQDSTGQSQTQSPESIDTDDGELIPSAPQTGDNFNIGVLLAVAISSLLAIIILLFPSKRKRDDR